jgi:hypothetical protein
VPKFVLILLVLIVPLRADVMVSGSCEGFVKDPSGNITSTPCTLPYGPGLGASGSITSFHIQNYIHGYVQSNMPGAMVDVEARQTASISEQVVVTGGTGSGKLIFDGTRDFDYFPDGIHAVGQYPDIQSNMVTFSQFGFGFGPLHTEVPFVFGVPLLLWITSDIQVTGFSHYDSSYLGFETVDTWNFDLTAILDDNGQQVSLTAIRAAPATVPEPAGWLLVATALIITGLLSRVGTYGNNQPGTTFRAS